MAITVLPPTTIHLLNSAQVLTTPISLVKELVDNALDAKATSIDIIISPNTLDKIEVRDNGHGIQPDDLDALARHGYTSKLRSFEELIFRGGDTLGFRGEALASAVELGEVTVSTKTEGETIATMVKLKETGGVDHQTRTSHPVGTTVSVKNFMAKLPVRKKTFEKEATKSIAKINRLLKGYALARPSIKFSLKVSNGGKGSWSFTPHPSGDVREAVLRTIGRDTALQCLAATMPSDDASKIADLLPEVPTNHGRKPKHFTIDAFLPHPRADPSKIGGDQFLSVDSRPISHEKGTMKKIVAMFKKHIRRSLNDMDDKLKSPFICLNIQCPVATYDANIEPAKDDVLFGNEDVVLETAEKLFRTVYGPFVIQSNTSGTKLFAESYNSVEFPPMSEPPISSDMSRQHRPIAASTKAQSHITQPPSFRPISPRPQGVEVVENRYVNEAHVERQTRWGFDMSEDFTEEGGNNDKWQNRNKNTKADKAYSQGQMQLGPRTNFNPWSIAKLSPHSARDTATVSTYTNSSIKSTSRTPGSYDLHESTAVVPKSNHGDQDPLCSLSPKRLSITSKSDLFISDDEQPRRPTCVTDFVTARSIIQDALLSPPPTQSSKSSSKSRVLEPFVSPFQDSGIRTQSDGLRQMKFASIYKPSPSNNGQLDVSDKSDLAWAMHFEKRKEEATRRRRQEIRELRAARNDAVTSKDLRSSPHKSRYDAATASLEAGQLSIRNKAQNQANILFQSSISDDDPRAYFMRQRRSMESQMATSEDAPKLMLQKSKKLPLETVTREDQLQQLIQSIPVKANTLQQMTLILTKYNASVGRLIGLSIEPKDVPETIERLQAVVSSWLNDFEDQEVEIEYTLGNLSKR
jgi:DNA mismatch repair protein MutL